MEKSQSAGFPAVAASGAEGPGMGGGVGALHVGEADVSIDLGGGERGVAQQLLHGVEVGAVVEQGGGACVAQGAGP